jgi:hypothetical protein
MRINLTKKKTLTRLSWYTSGQERVKKADDRQAIVSWQKL